MKMRIFTVLIVLGFLSNLTMDRPLRSKKSPITTTQGLNRAEVATKNLQALINDVKQRRSPTYLEQIERLVLQGANPNIANSDGLSVLGLVIEQLRLKNSSPVVQKKIIKTLLNSGASVSGLISPLYYAITNDLPVVVELLLEYGAIITNHDRDLALVNNIKP